MKVLINGTCYLANQELAFRKNDKSATSLNCGNYVELIYAFAENNESISRHLKISTVFSALSNRIQNEIIEAVAEVIRTDIRKDINNAFFVSAEVDETKDIMQKAQISVIFRYVCEQRRSSRPPNPPIGGAQANVGAQVSLKLLFGYVTIFSSADLFTTDLNCRKKLACDIISECNVILSRRI